MDFILVHPLFTNLPTRLDSVLDATRRGGCPVDDWFEVAFKRKTFPAYTNYSSPRNPEKFFIGIRYPMFIMFRYDEHCYILNFIPMKKDSSSVTPLTSIVVWIHSYYAPQFHLLENSSRDEPTLKEFFQPQYCCLLRCRKINNERALQIRHKTSFRTLKVLYILLRGETAKGKLMVKMLIATL